MSSNKRKSTGQGRRGRSFGGCITCRRRHLKCDESRPSCNTCRDAKVRCGGYGKAVYFEPVDGSSVDTVRFRRPLFTENERSRMSDSLVKSVPENQAFRCIDQIEQSCEMAGQANAFQICRGPFGAFRLGGYRLSSKEPTPMDIVNDGQDDPVPRIHELDHHVDDSFAMMPTFQSMFDDTISETFPSSSMDLWSISQDANRIEEIFDLDSLLPNMQQPPFTPLDSTGFEFLDPLPAAIELPNTDQSSPESLTLNRGPDTTLPHDAVTLVKHYSDTVLRALTPFRHTKTPWHVLFVPHAKTCLAALTLGESLDHASLCAFYGMLAVSAFNLSQCSGSQVWVGSGKSHQQQAQYHAKFMLRTAYDVPKTAKYKSILIALLTMVQLAMVSGDAEQTDRYFMETEKFIRVKGLNRKKSRKIRLLHHCYVFERLFHESTFVSGLNSTHRQHVRKAIESSGAVAHSHDSLTFRLGKWSNLDDEMMKIKNVEEGENDLHLEIPGVWSATLYPEIFGVPEIYVFLLSLTIRLGEQKDAAEQQESSEALSLKDFMMRAKAVEQSISSLRHYIPTQSNFADQQSASSLQTILKAMQNALAIYFYRRIYDVDASILQPKVDAIRDCLAAFEPALSTSTYGIARLIWPAFIAGCESEDPIMRAFIVNWLERAARSSGSRLFSDAKSNIERIWEHKTGEATSNVSWFDLLKANKHFVTVS